MKNSQKNLPSRPLGLFGQVVIGPPGSDYATGILHFYFSQQNFLALCASDYYKGCIFHRNIKGFIVQTGDPTGTGKNGQSIWKQKFKDEFNEALKHTARGVVSMANNGPDSNGSQFFITYSKQTMLDMKYSIFGKCVLRTGAKLDLILFVA
nr:unnamed protein product [Spirometra erinaceieuropaei]